MTTLFQNIKHPYISPEVTFEEMEEESFVMWSVGGNDEGMGSGEGNPTGGTTTDPYDPWKKSPAKSSIFDESFDDPFEFIF